MNPPAIVLRRHSWRAMPLIHVVSPPMNGPLLAFTEENQPQATLLWARIEDLAVRYKRAHTADQKRQLATRIRKTHLWRVSLAIGVRNLSLPGWPRSVIHEFVE